MYHTMNDLPETTRKKVIDLLQERLAEAIDLTLQTKHAHWNVKGPEFYSLHKLFDKIHKESGEYVDLIAERIAQFGGIAEGTIEAVTQNSSLPCYPLTALREREHIEMMSGALAAFGKMIRQGIQQTGEWEDLGTADILTEISRNVDKNLWFVENHLVERDAPRVSARGAA